MQPIATSGAGRETEFLGPKQGADDHIAAGFELAVHLDHDAAAQVVEHQRLMRFRQAQFPRSAGVFDAGQRRSAGAAVVAADENHVGVRLGDAGRDGADADFRHQLDADASVAVGVFQIVNQLRQVFDGVNVMVRRRRNQADARRRMAHLGDPWINLAAGQLAALAGFGSLGHLDLQFLGVDEIKARHAESAGRHLLDRAILGIAVRLRDVAGRVFAALAGVALAADAVHGDGQRLVRLLADRAIGHGARLEPLQDRFDRLDFLNRNGRFGEFQPEEAAQRAEPFGLVVDQFAVFLENLVIAVAAGVLQFVDRLRVEKVVFPLLALLIMPARLQSVAVERPVGKRLIVARLATSAAMASRPTPAMREGVQVKYLSMNGWLQSDGLENLRAAIALDAWRCPSWTSPWRRPCRPP